MNPNHKKSKIVKIIIVFLILLLIVTFVVYGVYTKNNGKEQVRKEFFEKIGNNEISFFLENDLYATMLEKVEKEDYYASSNIKLSTTMENNMFSQLDLSKFEILVDVTKEAEEEEYSSNITAKYAENNVLTLNAISNQNQFALKSDEIVNRYVGIDKKNTQNIAEKLLETDVDLTDAKKIKNFLWDREWISLEKIASDSRLNTYAELLKNNTTAENFSKKENVVVTLDSEQVTTTEYTLNLTTEQVKAILDGISEELGKDEEMVSELVVDKVEDFEEEQQGILEYNDNENTVEISGQESNFNTSINIWGENTVNETPETNTVLPEDNTISNQTVENTVPLEDVAQNTIVEENEVTVNPQTTQENSEQQEVEQIQEAEPETPAEVVEEPLAEENTEENVIEEEDNVRTQGFIEVNEEQENPEVEEEENTFIIGNDYEETLKNIVQYAEKIDWTSYILTGAKANQTQEEMTEYLQEILEARRKANQSLVVKIYVSEEKTVKAIFEIPETSESLDIEIIAKSDNEKYLNIKVLKGQEENANGYTISLYKKNANAAVKSKISINKIQKNKISQKWNLNLDTNGTTNSKKYTNQADFLYSGADGEFKVELGNSLNFDVVSEVEALNYDNCLFLDTISEEELLLTRDAIWQKSKEVLKEKNRNLNIIDTNNANSVVQQTEGNTESEDTEAKETAKQALIQTVSNKMKDYLDRGEQLQITDLEGLEIPGYEVRISISSNLAIITVNGFEFKLDSEFNLSDS